MNHFFGSLSFKRKDSGLRSKSGTSVTVVSFIKGVFLILGLRCCTSKVSVSTSTYSSSFYSNHTERLNGCCPLNLDEKLDKNPLNSLWNMTPNVSWKLRHRHRPGLLDVMALLRYSPSQTTAVNPVGFWQHQLTPEVTWPIKTINKSV